MSKTKLPLLEELLESIDTGRFFRQPFSLIYLIIAILNLLFPLYVLYLGIEDRIFDYSFKHGFYFVLVWLGLIGVALIGFLVWLNRRQKIVNIGQESDEFVATPVFAHFLQTFGEWLGIYIALFGFYSSFIGLIFNLKLAGIFNLFGISPFVANDLFSLIILPIFGYLIIVIFRFFAEQIRALTAIANNTRK